MEEKLKYIFEQINHWLSFAEAKNAMIIVINITLVIAEGSLLLGNTVSLLLTIVIIISMALLIISTVIILYSFLPFTGTFKPSNSTSGDYDDLNLLFFGDIASIEDPLKYLSLLHEKYEGKSMDKAIKFEAEIANEIVYNSRLTVRKYRLFKYGLYVTISAISTPAIALIIWIISRRRFK